ncbi:transporter [Photorhabdus luminescens subsp. luminescens]|uniref:Protein transport protein HofQ n=1 Tax=Photorhabdus luminescens TaxID=29488 RepID=A0A1G5QCS1_PHOLU|nr:type IV pilus secretin PilQ [Photorhabdus luminescens]KMW72457.1 transporter [Photorhabdus luminescens subsp. luminescens]SCZ59487.1 protein transport protein HofQ [Photorhabdus luminescens]
MTKKFILFILFLPAIVVAEIRNPFAPPMIETEEQSVELFDQSVNETEIQSLSTVLQYADAERITVNLRQNRPALITKEGKVDFDPETNSLILQDTPIAIAQIKSWLKEIDTPQQQVQITAHIVTSSREALHELGIYWGMPIGEPINATTGLNRLNINQAANDNMHRFSFNIARIHTSLLEMELSALEQENQLDIIASPRLTASHQQLASIKQGSDIPYVSQEKEKSTVQFKEAVLGMEVTPHILRKNKIRLSLKISQNMPGISISQGGGENLTIDKQEIITQVTVKNGETLILGGIFQQKKGEQTQKVPYLSDIPLLGSLFNQKGHKHSRRELVIFITPQLMDI